MVILCCCEKRGPHRIASASQQDLYPKEFRDQFAGLPDKYFIEQHCILGFFAPM